VVFIGLNAPRFAAYAPQADIEVIGLHWVNMSASGFKSPRKSGALY